MQPKIEQKLEENGVTKEKSKPKNQVANIERKHATGLNNWQTFLSSNNQEINEINAEIEETEQDVRGKCVAIDCEMVGIGRDSVTNMLARVSVVNAIGDCLYDTFVKPTAPVTDYRTHVSGVRPTDLANAEYFNIVQKTVAKLISGKFLVGHAVHNDLSILQLNHPRHKIRDTSRFKKFNQLTRGTPSLKMLTSRFLNVNIQDGEHSSIQDAQAAMQLYMLHRKEWEAEIREKTHRNHVYRNQKKKPKTTHRPRRLHKNYKK